VQPKAMAERKTPEQIIEEEIIQARKQIEQRNNTLKQISQALKAGEHQQEAEEVEFLIAKEVQRAGLGQNIYSKYKFILPF
jgi:hypothetical protein